MKLADITTEDITTLVGLLTEVQKNELVGVYYSADSIYNPIQDIDDNWVISTEEMIYTTNEDTLWVKDLELIEYKPKPTPSPF
jgi:hypothetical protein